MNLNLNFLQELRDLDPRDPGRWPLAVLAAAVGATFLAADAVSDLFLRLVRMCGRSCSRRRRRSSRCGRSIQHKHAQAVNLAVYKQQLKDLQRSFGALLRQLPGKTEVPNLLVDISQTALGAGLQQKLFQPDPSRRRTSTRSCPSRWCSPAAITSSASS